MGFKFLVLVLSLGWCFEIVFLGKDLLFSTVELILLAQWVEAKVAL